MECCSTAEVQEPAGYGNWRGIGESCCSGCSCYRPSGRLGRSDLRLPPGRDFVHWQAQKSRARIRGLESSGPKSRGSVLRSGPFCGRRHCGCGKPFEPTPRDRERVEQGNVGNCTRTGAGRSALQGLFVERRSSANPAPVRVEFGCRFNHGGCHSLLDCTSHDARDNPASALLYCAYGLSVWLYPFPVSIDRGSRSSPCSVQPGTVLQLLVRHFAMTRAFLAESSDWVVPFHVGPE